MKRIAQFAFVGAIVALGSCGGKSTQPTENEEIDTTVVVTLDEDSLVYGIGHEHVAVDN